MFFLLLNSVGAAIMGSVAWQDEIINYSQLKRKQN